MFMTENPLNFSPALTETYGTPEQIRQRKINKKGIQLNILLIGENGIGKKSFMNTLCNQRFFNDDENENENENEYVFNERRELSIESHIIDVIEPGSIPIKLKASFTKNFGYNLNNSTNAALLVKHVESEFRKIFNEEIKINRNPRFEDNRIHVGLYFIRPTGKGLCEFDIANMKALSHRINLIPIIAKSDTLTEDENKLNKHLISDSIENNDIRVFNFLDDYLDEDYDYLRGLQQKLPFTIISANKNAVRETPWGSIDINDIDVCDFKVLRNILFGSHIHDLKDITVNKKYEQFRIEQLLPK